MAGEGDDALRHALARRFEQVRSAHRNETAEDYVELIAELIAARGEARVGELAARLGVAQPTVNKVLVRLRREGLVEGRPYRAVLLTEAGSALAARMRERHAVVLDFLLSIGVNEETARLDAEGIEHHVSEETLDAFRRATRRDASGSETVERS